MERLPHPPAAPSGALAAAGSPHTSPADAASDWAALDALTFDSSLSFLADIDTVADVTLANDSSLVDEPPGPRSPLLLPESDDDDIATAALLDDMLALDVDPRTTERAEGTVAEADVSGVADAPKPPSTSPPPASQQKSKSTSTRLRQKEEIEYLRTQVAELESELARKQPVVGDGNPGTSSSTVSMWANIAQRQSAEKQRAEIENVKLREMLEGQLRVARSLEKLLRRRAVTEADPLFLERKRGRDSPALDLEHAVGGIEARIARQLDDVEGVITECGLGAIMTDFDDVKVTSDATHAIFMELTMVKVFPFELPEVAEAVWQLLCTNRIALPSGHFDATERSETLADFQFAVNLRVRRSEATIHVRGVATRRIITDQSLIAFETVGTTDGPLFSGQGISCRERGYSVVHPGPIVNGTPSTIVKVCVRLWPEADTTDSTSRGAPDVGLFVDLVVGSYNQNVKTMLQEVENTLLARHLAN